MCVHVRQVFLRTLAVWRPPLPPPRPRPPPLPPSVVLLSCRCHTQLIDGYRDILGKKEEEAEKRQPFFILFLFLSFLHNP